MFNLKESAMIYNGLIFIEQDLRDMIDQNLGRTGLLYRLHSRIKEQNSIEDKIERKGYRTNGKLIQDLIGIRVMTYFNEDIEVLVDYFKTIFDVINMEHDDLNINSFDPVRINLVCRLPKDQLREFDTWKSKYGDSFKYIDSTFEIQIRTTLSEGWHEIEHNMRYKCKNEWNSLEEESKMLNGIHATLETSDRTLFKLFEEISYQHYKSKNWTGMLRNKFRLRFELDFLSEDISRLFDDNKELAKQFYKLERNSVLNDLISNDLSMDISFDNIIYLSNYLYVRDERILQLTPPSLLNNFEHVFDLEPD